MSKLKDYSEPWTVDDILYLKYWYDKKTYAQLAKSLDRYKNSVVRKCKDLGLCKIDPKHQRIRKSWTQKEKQFISENHAYLSKEEICAKLNRSKSSVEHMMNRLNFKEPYTNKKIINTVRKYWTDDEIDYLYREYGRTDTKKMAKRLNRSVSSVKHKCEKLRIPFKDDEMLCQSDIARAFNIDKTAVSNWKIKRKMPVKEVNISGQKRCYIDEKEFWKWAIKNQKSLPWWDYELGSIDHEPKELSEIIQKYPKPSKNHRKAYTLKEMQNIAVDAKKYGTQYAAYKYGRSIHSVRHICQNKPYQNGA